MGPTPDPVVFRGSHRHRVQWRLMLIALAGGGLAALIVAASVARVVPVALSFAGMLAQGPISYRWGWRWGALVVAPVVVAYWLALGAAGFSDLDAVSGLVGIAGLAAAMFAMSELGYTGKALHQTRLFDPITKLANYDFFVTMLHHELARAERHRVPFSLILLEIADFDAFTQRRGYRQADVTLREIARVMDGVLRDSDILARLGGPAFGLLLPMTPTDGAMVVLDWLRHALRNWQPLTAMLGHSLEWHAAVVQYPIDGQTIDELLARAEAILNQARPSAQATVAFEQLVIYARELQQLYKTARFDPSLPERVQTRRTIEAPPDADVERRQG